MLRIAKVKKVVTGSFFSFWCYFLPFCFFSTKILLKKPITLNQMVLVHPSLEKKSNCQIGKVILQLKKWQSPRRQKRYYRTVPNILALFHFEKVSRKETVFNQSNGRKFENSLFAQENSLTEQRDYFWIFWAKRLFSNFLPFDWLKTVSFYETFLKWKRAKTLGTVLKSCKSRCTVNIL